MTSVPYVDLKSQYAAQRDEIIGAIDRVLASGEYILGSEVTLFEKAFATLCGCTHALGVANGTDAIVLVLKALGIGAGDEVVTAPNSYLASASAIVLAGARPTFADVGDDYNLDPQALEKAITPRTRAVIVVHLTGRPARMAEIQDVAQRHGVYLIEDAAQAVGAKYNGRPVGSFGIAGCFSTHPLKNLNACGDGGVIVTSDSSLAEKLRLWRNHGLRTRDECAHWAYNSRLDSVQAAILNVRLRHLDAVTAGRRETAAWYRTNLPASIEVPTERPNEFSVYHTFVIQVDDRDRVQESLRMRGVETKIHYPIPIHLQPAAASLGYAAGDFPEAERQARRSLSLPVHAALTSNQKQHVVEALVEATALRGSA